MKWESEKRFKRGRKKKKNHKKTSQIYKKKKQRFQKYEKRDDMQTGGAKKTSRPLQ